MIVSFHYFFILPRNCIRGLWRIGDPRCSPQPLQMADHQAGLFQLWTQLPDLCGLCDEHLVRDHDSRLADVPQPGQKTHQKDFFSAHCFACPFLDSAFGGKSQCLRLWVHEQPRPVLGSDACENLLPLASLLLLFLRVVCTVQSLASPRQVCLPIGQLSCSSLLPVKRYQEYERIVCSFHYSLQP